MSATALVEAGRDRSAESIHCQNFIVGQNQAHGNSHNRVSCWHLKLLGISI